ncbi:hypothetical protein RB653_0035221 [Dictyostelium firmibasis]|uniref:Probable enoyl-CoA hydratase, mitochondrial n=1 Tax=Dictyostelium firmibasis TaxID=79012 RepID=A0AAN7UDK2_9MYCE
MESALNRINIISNQIVNETSFLEINNTSSEGTNKYKFETILVNIIDDSIALVTFNRPKALNSFNYQMGKELLDCCRLLDKDDNVKCIVLTGSGTKSFACGADIKEMANHDMAYMMKKGHLIDNLCDLREIEKPIIAAVNGYALGGGCEVAMICDIIVAGENAVFGQPETKIGTIPGAGGSQRLIRAVGKSKAMEMILTGNPIDAQQALQFGLVSCVVPIDKTIETALKMAKQIASLSPIIIKLAKVTVNNAQESNLTEGLNIERRIFHSTFALKDRSEGMNSFANKRKPNWTNN